VAAHSDPPRISYQSALAFNQDLDWDTGNVENMENMFLNAEAFNGDISGWDTSNVESMEAMFAVRALVDS